MNLFRVMLGDSFTVLFAFAPIGHIASLKSDPPFGGQISSD
jgi:hypothetical protein